MAQTTDDRAADDRTADDRTASAVPADGPTLPVRPDTPGPRTGSAVPARLRIVAWIVLTAGLGLLAVVLTVRSVLLSDVEQSANEAVVQEIDEFRTFAQRGLDPATGRPFGSADRLLGLYLERQFPGSDEVLLGWDDGAAARGAPALLVQAAGEDGPQAGLRGDPGLVRTLVDGPERSGTVAVGDEEVRWGRTDVVGGPGAAGGTFLVGVALEPGRAAVGDVVRLVLLVSLGGLVLVAAFAFAVAGQILAPVRAAGRAVGAVARSGLDRRVEVRGRDDVASLALAVNALLDRLHGDAAVRDATTAAAASRIRTALGPHTADPAARDAAAALDDLQVLTAAQDPARRRIREVDLADLGESLDADVRARGSRWTVEGRLRGTARLDPDLVRAALARLCTHVEAREPSGGPLHAVWRTVPADRGGALLEVEVTDALPAPDAGDAGRAFHPGEADGRSDTSDAVRPGTALAVVAAVAEAHDGQVWAGPRPGGAGFGFALPLDPPADGS